MPPKRKPYVAPGNDNLSNGFDALNLVPDRSRGTEKFLDVVTWNIRYFNQYDAARTGRVVEILAALNADVMIFQEILHGSLEVVADELNNRAVGRYTVSYGTTGGQQRVAIMHDIEWVRTKDDVTELFGKGQVSASDGKDAFPRLPLWASLTALTDTDPFDFQLLGVHLKSQRDGGGPQRLAAARALADWLSKDAPKVDADVIIIGDWNAQPKDKAWSPFHRLETEKRAAFKSVNDDSDFSHLMYRNKQEIGTRLDLAAISTTARKALKANPKVVRWTSLDQLLGTSPSAVQLKQYISEIRETVSDHLPVVTRFYFTDPDE